MNRKFKYFFTLLIGSLSLNSCQRDLLNPSPQTSITDASAFDTPSRILNQILALYGTLKSGTFYGGRYVVYGDIRGEDFINETGNLVTGSDVWSLNVANSTTSVKGLWSQAYYVINNCNLFIDGMNAKGSGVVGTTLSANYIAEARLIRALSYYSLAQLYARPFADGDGSSKYGLPLRLTGIKGSGSSDLARSTVGAIYTQIIADLDFAEANLPASYSNAYNNTTRAHKNTAIALKTRVYLSMGGDGSTSTKLGYLAKVIAEAQKIVPQTTAPFSATSGVNNALQTNVTNVFKTPYTTSESILSMPMTTTSGDYPGTQNSLCTYYYMASSTPGSTEFSLNSAGIAGNLTAWPATDQRRTLLFTSGAKQFVAKYTTGSPYTDYVPVMRYAEVLLNYAEALARTSSSVNTTAVNLLKAVRARSDGSYIFPVFATPADLISAILTERRIEFLGEGLRNGDLMRLLQTIPAKGSAPSKAPSESQYIWPISSDELSLNRLCDPNP